MKVVQTRSMKEWKLVLCQIDRPPTATGAYSKPHALSLSRLLAIASFRILGSKARRAIAISSSMRSWPCWIRCLTASVIVSTGSYRSLPSSSLESAAGRFSDATGDSPEELDERGRFRLRSKISEPARRCSSVNLSIWILSSFFLFRVETISFVNSLSFLPRI